MGCSIYMSCCSIYMSCCSIYMCCCSIHTSCCSIYMCCCSIHTDKNDAIPSTAQLYSTAPHEQWYHIHWISSASWTVLYSPFRDDFGCFGRQKIESVERKNEFDTRLLSKASWSLRRGNWSEWSVESDVHPEPYHLQQRAEHSTNRHGTAEFLFIRTVSAVALTGIPKNYIRCLFSHSCSFNGFTYQIPMELDIPCYFPSEVPILFIRPDRGWFVLPMFDACRF